jgi:DNA mismatch repair protein MutL
MTDIINLLPDSVANQIAAGEVIQRPASVVKELVENAIDAGADSISVVIKDAGRTLIQITDNGKGMSEMDARMAFERHATSKITSVQDLFSLKTMGFRGEALPSIAAVAQVELKTKRKEDEIGTLVEIAGSVIARHESIGSSNGTTFSVKNLFFNVPARRKFLKSNETEFKNILTEFERVALVRADIAFTLIHNGVEVYNLPVSNIKLRIKNIFGNKINQQLIPVDVKTSLIEVSGFIGNPESAKKRAALQYFFVNGRYMRHPYFNKSIALAMEAFIPSGFQPNYFLYFEVDPSTIDINIHPTKTEIKFENEQAIFQILSAVVKEAIAIPSLEFDQEGAFDMPVYTEKRKEPVKAPQVSIRSDYNPFKEYHKPNNTPTAGWETLYPNKNEVFPSSSLSPSVEPLFEDKESRRENFPFISYKGKYLLALLPSGLTVINQRRAHIRVLFDEYIRKINQKQGLSQRLLFPEEISFTPKEATVLPCILDDFVFMGFDLEEIGSNTYSINGVPEGLDNMDVVDLLQDMTNKVLEIGCEVKEEVSEIMALTLAKKAAISSEKILSQEEVMNLVNRLLSSSSPNYTPDGKLIISALGEEELSKRFK